MAQWCPVPWKCVKKLFFKKGLISDLILLGTANKHIFLQKKTHFFWLKHVFFQKKCLPRFLATIANLPNNAWVQNNLDFFVTIANLATTQDTTITMTMTYFHDLAFRFQDTSWLVTTWPGTPWLELSVITFRDVASSAASLWPTSRLPCQRPGSVSPRQRWPKEQRCWP